MPQTQNNTQNNEPLSRSVCVKLAPSVAKVLLANRAKVQQLSLLMQQAAAMDQEFVRALAADAGHELESFERWDYEEGKDGVVFLKLVPPQLPPPPPPQKPVPRQEG